MMEVALLSSMTDAERAAKGKTRKRAMSVAAQ